MLDLSAKNIRKIKRAEVMVIGCSAGGFNLVFELLLKLDKNFPLAVIVIIHRNRKYKSSIEGLLNQKSNIPVMIAADKEPLIAANVYFAPADYHLLVEPNGLFTLDDSEPLFYCRPAIDVTFESLSDVYTNKVIGMLLSGANEDGAKGMNRIGNNGGLTIVQNPESAEVGTMPEAAIKMGNIDLILTNQELFMLIEAITILKNDTNE